MQLESKGLFLAIPRTISNDWWVGWNNTNSICSRELERTTVAKNIRIYRVKMRVKAGLFNSILRLSCREYNTPRRALCLFKVKSNHGRVSLVKDSWLPLTSFKSWRLDRRLNHTRKHTAQCFHHEWISFIFPRTVFIFDENLSRRNVITAADGRFLKHRLTSHTASGFIIFTLHFMINSQWSQCRSLMDACMAGKSASTTLGANFCALETYTPVDTHLSQVQSITTCITVCGSGGVGKHLFASSRGVKQKCIDRRIMIRVGWRAQVASRARVYVHCWSLFPVDLNLLEHILFPSFIYG